MSECPQNCAGKGCSSQSAETMTPILFNGFKGSGSEITQGVPERLNQSIQDVKLLWYFHIRIWGSIRIVMNIKSGESW